jgi:hypothetical protein
MLEGRQVPGQLGSGESQLSEHHSKLWTSTHGQWLSMDVSHKMKIFVESEPFTMRSFPMEYVLMTVRQRG